MKDLKQYIEEKLIINKNYKSYKYCPKSWDELRQIIEDRYEEQGPGTEQSPIDFNDIDVSKMTMFFNESTSEGIFEKTKFEYMDVSDWDVSNIKYMNCMFWGCVYLKSIGDISNWDVSNVENMKYMFNCCEKLKSVGNLSKWDVSNVYNMNYMFRECKKLKSVGDLSNWNVSKIEYKNYMFMFNKSNITNIPSWYKG